MATVITRQKRVQNVLAEFGLNTLQSGASDGITWFATQGPPLDTFDPTTEEYIGRVITATTSDCAVIVERLQKVFLKWRRLSFTKRADMLNDVGARLLERIDSLSQLIAIEMGKTVEEARGEIMEAIHMCRFVQGLARQIGGLPLQSERELHFMFEQYHPYGVVGCMTAWNFPVAVLFWNWALALLCGNVGLWKPSSVTPLISIAIQRILNEVAAEHGHPGVAALVIGSGGTVGEWMLAEKRLRLISFTGSSATGSIVGEKVGKRFGRTILECGGNNAITVTPNADLETVVRTAPFAVTGTTGQRCTTTRRLIVHESVYDALLKRIVNVCAQVKIGDPLEPGTRMGPLINAEARKMMFDAVDRAVQEGGQIVPIGCEGVSIGNFVKPTIIRMPSQTPIVHEETFAPILYVMTYHGALENAIAMNNDVPQGLSSSIFTENLAEAMLFISAMGSDCGIANVNCAPSGAEIGGAFGGEKETGGGREAGSDSWKQYMRRQTSTLFWGTADEMTFAQGIKFDVEEKKEPTYTELFNERLMQSFDPDKKS